MRLLSLGLSLWLVGCASSATFVRTDSAHQESPSAGAPDVCTKQRPTLPYRVVGEIRVRLDPEVSTDLDYAAEAMRKAAEVGCDAVIDSRLARSSALDLPTFFRLAHGGDEGSGSTPGSGQGGRSANTAASREFECVVYIHEPHASVSALEHGSAWLLSMVSQ